MVPLFLIEPSRGSWDLNMKTKRKEFTWGRVSLSSQDYHSIVRPSLLIQEPIGVDLTMCFLVLKMRGESQGSGKGELACLSAESVNVCIACGSSYRCTFPRASSASAIGWDEGRERGWSMKRAAIRKDSFKHMCNARRDCCWVLSLIKSAWLSIDQNFSSPDNLDQAVPPKSPGFTLSSFVSQEWI